MDIFVQLLNVSADRFINLKLVDPSTINPSPSIHIGSIYAEGATTNTMGNRYTFGPILLLDGDFDSSTYNVELSTSNVDAAINGEFRMVFKQKNKI